MLIGKGMVAALVRQGTKYGEVKKEQQGYPGPPPHEIEHIRMKDA